MRRKWLIAVCIITMVFSGLFANGNSEVSFFTGKVETIDLMNEIINDFNSKETDFSISQEYQKDASSIIKVKFASGEIPDIMTTYEQAYVDQSKYLDLSGEFEWWNRLIPSMKDNCTDIKTGKQYRVCTNMTMGGLFYNKDLYNELGLKPAVTWDEFVQNLETIKRERPDVTPLFVPGKEAWSLGHWIEFVPHGYLKQTLGSRNCKIAMLENDSSKLNFGAPDGAMAEFARNLVELQNKGLINSDVLTATADNRTEAFVNGKAAMFSDGMWALGGILAANPDMNIGFAPYPSYMPGTKPVVLSAEDSGYCISASSLNIEGAKEFLNYLFSTENMKKYSEALGSPSAFKDVDANWAPKAFRDEVVSVLNTSANIGFTNEKPAGFSGDDAGRMVQDLLAGTYTPEEFALAYEKAWNEGF
ncbi:MAG: extracellular solute-binding protein [Sphaerochaetaceae bacterium]|nr:extracellular solute-binding protein [Sphaerochaetaceae bacterium]